MSQDSTAEIERDLRQAIYPGGGAGPAAIFILLNFAIYFMRPQEIGPLSFLGTIRLPLFIALPPLLIWLANCTRGWAFQTRVMMFFTIAEALRTVLGKLVWDDLVVNDFWAFMVLKDFFLQFATLIFPFVIYFASGRNLRSFLRVWVFVGFFLALYVATHGGKGPGGFLEDENDAGLALLFFLPIPLAYLTETRMGTFARLKNVAVVGLILVAVVATFSRGTFVGLVCVLGYFFLRSRRKFLLVAGLAVFAFALVPFVPQEYLDEIHSIKDTSSGTAEIRKHYWKLATRVWLDPRHVLIGVGMNNVSFHVGRYESMSDLEKFPSAAGRAMHSMYFQILPDLGLWGILVVSLVTIPSVRSNRRMFRSVEAELKSLNSESSGGPGREDLRSSIQGELEFVRPMLLATNIAFAGVFSAGAFISVLYYPMLWFLAGLSIPLARYSERILEISSRLRLLPQTPKP